MKPLQAIGVGVTLVAVLSVPAAATSVQLLADDATEATRSGAIAESAGGDPAG